MDELKVLWKGVCLRFCLSRFVLMFWVVVISIFFDVLVIRKICGFKGYLVIFGCFCCLKKFFGGFGEK